MLASHRSLRLAVYAILAALLYLPALGAPALWEPDEGRYAEIAREMVVTRDYVTPRNNFELYFEKPPLMYWCDAAIFCLRALCNARSGARLFSYRGTRIVLSSIPIRFVRRSLEPALDADLLRDARV